MTAFIRAKVLHLVPVLFAVTCFSFLLSALLPGDIAVLMAGPNASAQSIAALRQQLQLDQPLPVRYVDWLGRAVRGDLGTSPRSHQTVIQSIKDRLPISL